MRGPEGCHLDYLAPIANMYYLETPANRTRIPENLSYLLRSRVGSNIEIFRVSTQQQITHSTTDQISGITRFDKTFEYFPGAVTNEIWINFVRFAWDANDLLRRMPVHEIGKLPV